MRNEAWANYIRDKRKKRGFTRRHLAILAKIDPSYMTLIERDGIVPKRDKVIALADVMDIDVGDMLLMAGYAPIRNYGEDMKKSYISASKFTPDLLYFIKFLSERSTEEQDRIFNVIKICLEALGYTAQKNSRR